MNIKKNKRFTFIAILGLFLLLAGNKVYAKNFETYLTSNQTKIEPGQIITVKVGLKNLGKTNVFLANLEYDINIFNKVESKDMKVLNGWTGLSYNKDNGMLLMERADKTASIHETDILEISFTAKTEIKEKNTQIRIIDAHSAVDGNELVAPDMQLNIEIEEGKSISSIIITIIIFIVAEAITGYVIFKIIKKIEKKKEDKKEG